MESVMNALSTFMDWFDQREWNINITITIKTESPRGRPKGNVSGGCLNISKSCTKHIDLAYNIVRVEIENENILLNYVPSNKNIANMFASNAIM